MKRLNYLMNGLAALALIVLFAQCAGNTDKQTTNAPAQSIRTTLIFLRREHSRNTTALQSWSRICRT